VNAGRDDLSPNKFPEYSGAYREQTFIAGADPGLLRDNMTHNVV
jgi:hypothetical protein